MAKKQAKRTQKATNGPAKRASKRKPTHKKTISKTTQEQAVIRRKKTKKTTFQKRNTAGEKTQWKSGQSGNPEGRPPNAGSPRAQLKRYAEETAPKRLRSQIRKHMPDVDVQHLTWAQLIALAHLLQATKGDMTALNAIYKQIDDQGVDLAEIGIHEAPSKRIMGKLARLRQRKAEAGASG